MVLMGLFLVGTQALAQQKSVTGRVLSDGGAPIAGAQVIVKGTRFGGMTNADGLYSVRVEVGQVLQFRYIGTAPEERTVGAESVINVTLRKVATGLDAIVVSALGQTSVKRSSGVGSQARPSWISRKSHGLMRAPRASITERTPERAMRSEASKWVRMSPLPTTGTERSAATRPIRSQSAARL